MRALGVSKFGPPSALQFIEDVSEPVVSGAGEIIVAVRAVGLNPGDPIRAAGWSRLLESVKCVFCSFMF
jgi:NADPH:quinone reductase-like Zn-dependent oxidoreductase